MSKYFLGVVAVVVIALMILVGSIVNTDLNAGAELDTYVTYGYVRTSWPITYDHSVPETMVSLRCDNGSVLNLKVHGLSTKYMARNPCKDCVSKRRVLF